MSSLRARPWRSWRSTAGAALAITLVAQVSAASAASDDGADWPSFGRDPGNSRYSPLAQIDESNFERLEIAWRWTSISRLVTETNDRIKAGQFKVVPVVVDGRLIVVSELSQVAAVDPATGKTLWTYDPESYRAGRPANVGFQHRGAVTWRDGELVRVFVATHDRKLVSLDAVTGEPVGGFGKDGVVDLLPDDGREHFGRRVNHRHLTHSSPPVVVSGVVIVGSIVHDGAIRRAAPPGHVRGFDARTGEHLWTFHTIAQEGELGVETWRDESWKYTGNTNLWSMMAVDHDLGMVYLPISTPTNDFYGGHRLGDNLFAESIVALDAETGERRWHFQAIHHGLWDYDFPTAPNLIDITVDGREIKALAQVSKQAFTYVFDRETGEPVWPIEERTVPQSTVPGERSSATQPFPTKPPAFDRQGITPDDLIDLTPELAAEALDIVKDYELGPIFSPPTPPGDSQRQIQLPGAGGGANWPGAAVDPQTGVLYVPSSTTPAVYPLNQPDPARSNLDYVGSFFADLRGPRGLPLVKPPWGRVTAIDLNRGEILWMTPNGEGPRDHPALADLDLPLLGSGSGAPLLTKTLLFVTQYGRPGQSPRINVFAKDDGELLGHIPLPSQPHANPITYLSAGRQYLVVAVGGGPFFAGSAQDFAQLGAEAAQALEQQSIANTTTPELIAFKLAN